MKTPLEGCADDAERRGCGRKSRQGKSIGEVGVCLFGEAETARGGGAVARVMDMEVDVEMMVARVGRRWGRVSTEYGDIAWASG